jgi:hypothetical protein
MWCNGASVTRRVRCLSKLAIGEVPASKIDRHKARGLPDLPPIPTVFQMLLVARRNLAEDVMATISRPNAHVAFVAALLLSGVGACLPIDSTYADDNCVGAAGAAAPAGQHWYYHIDRVKHRKCWYLHTIMPLPSRAAANPRASSSELAPSAATPQWPSAVTPQSPADTTAEATNVASASQPAADPSNPANELAGTQPVPQVTLLTVRPVAAPFVGTPSASQAVPPEQTGEPPVPQISPDDAKVRAHRETAPESRADPVTVPATTEPAHYALLPPDTAVAGSARTHAADRFFLLALALAIAAGLIALFGKMAGLTRTPRLSDHPDDAWRRVSYGEGAPFLAPDEPQGPVDLDAHEWIEPSQSAARPHDAELKQSEDGRPIRNDIERALRVLMQARQGVTQT